MPIVSFRVTAEVHEKLLGLAQERGQTLTKLMQDTADRIADISIEPRRSVVENELDRTRAQIPHLPPRKADPKIRGWDTNGVAIYERPVNQKAGKKS